MTGSESMPIKKVVTKNGIIKYVRVQEKEEPEDHKSKDLEIKRLQALIELLESKIKQLETNKPKEESAPSSDVMAVSAASTYSCYG